MFPDYQRFLAELKRRKVFRVALVYGATAFVVIEAADLVFGALQVPSWALTVAVTLTLLGFPIALVLSWAFESTPEGVRRTEAAAPEEVERIVSQPALKRWSSGLLALAGVGLLVTGAWWVEREGGILGSDDASTADSVAADAAVEPVEASIAVLPFVNMSSDPEQKYFSDGISEELLNLLARVGELRVAARTSSFAFEGQNLPIQVIADSLNVAYVLEGSVRKANDEVRITTQLIRAEDGYHLWSESWDRTLGDVFAVQDEIAAEVVERLRVTLLGEVPTVEETDPEAYALVLRARHLSDQRGADNLARAEELYRKALAIDSTYAAGWAGLATNYRRQSRGLSQESEEEHARTIARAVASAERALSLDPESARAHALLGAIALFEGDFAAAARRYERALALAPGDAEIVGGAGSTLASLGRLEEAIRMGEYAVARDPVNVGQHVNLGLTYYGSHRWNEAVSSWRAAAELSPDITGVPTFLGLALLHAGESEAGLAAIREEPAEMWRLVGEAIANHALGRTDESDAVLARMIEDYQRVGAFQIAQVLAYRGEVDRAFTWLDRAMENEDPGLSEIFLMPELDVLKDDPRWPAFLDRIGMSPEEIDAIEFEVSLPGERVAVWG